MEETCLTTIYTKNVALFVHRSHWQVHLHIIRNKFYFLTPFLSLLMPIVHQQTVPASKVNGANMGPTWVLSAPDGPHVGPMNLVIRGCSSASQVNLKDTGEINGNPTTAKTATKARALSIHLGMYYLSALVDDLQSLWSLWYSLLLENSMCYLKSVHIKM